MFEQKQVKVITKGESFSGCSSLRWWACADAARHRMPAEVQPGRLMKSPESEAEGLFIALDALQIRCGAIWRESSKQESAKILVEG